MRSTQQRSLQKYVKCLYFLTYWSKNTVLNAFSFIGRLLLKVIMTQEN